VQGIAVATRYPDDAAIAADAPASAEAAVLEADVQAATDDQRQELLTVLKNVAKLIPDDALAAVHAILARVVQPPDATAAAADEAGRHAHGSNGSACAAASWQDVEAALMMLYELGEAMLDEVGKSGCGKFAADVLAVMAAELPHQAHRLVASALLECYVRACCYRL
jgi:exportin-T